MIMKLMLAVTLLLSCVIECRADDSILGFWKTIDEHSGKAQCVVAMYEYQDKYYGRMVVTYNDDGSVNDSLDDPKDRAPGVKGDPYYVGLDFIWNLRKEGSKYTDGSIMDPKQGYVYGAEVWRDGDNLIVRGELLFLGRNQTWLPARDSDFPPGFKKPDRSKFVPVIPVPKPL